MLISLTYKVLTTTQPTVWVKKVDPLKVIAIFSFRLGIFLWNFTNLLPIYISAYSPIFVNLSSYLEKWCFFLGVLFIISSFQFHPVKLLQLHPSLPMISAPRQFIRPQATELLWGLGAMLESYHKLQPKQRTVPKFKDALQLIWSALLKKAIYNSVKDYHKRLQACVSANSGHFNVIIHITYILMLYSVKCYLMWLFKWKSNEFCNKQNWIV